MRPDFERGDGLIRAIAQEAGSKAILMDAFMNEEAWNETLATGLAVYFSRSRNQLWRKGEQSGNVQYVREIRINCNRDSVLLSVEQRGVACHDGYQTCFYRQVAVFRPPKHGSFTSATVVDSIIQPRIFDPSQVYEQ